MSALISPILERLVRVGRLRVEFADGSVGHYGDGTGPQVAVRFNDRAARLALAARPRT